MYGDVGCGKTFMMDMFYDTTPIHKKRRVHFHAFMNDVHHSMCVFQELAVNFEGIHEWRKVKGKEDPIPPLADELSKESWLICFDELQVILAGKSRVKGEGDRYCRCCDFASFV